MGNSREIADIKDHFLDSEQQVTEEQHRVYSLHHEFAQTRHNRSTLVYAIVAGFLLAIIIIALITLFVMQEQERKVAIDINEFEDLKLQALVASLGRVDIDLKATKRQLVELEIEHQRNLSVISQEHGRQMSELDVLELSDQERKQRHAALEGERREKIEALQTTYGQQSGQLKAKVERLEQTASKERGSVTGPAEDRLSVQNPEQRLYELKMDKLRSDYEEKIVQLRQRHQQEREALIARYNPTFSEEALLQLIAGSVPRRADPAPLYLLEDNYLVAKGLADPQQLEALNQRADQQLALIARMGQIPFINSPQRAMLHLDSLSKSLLSDVGLLNAGLTLSLQRRDETLAHFNYFLGHVVRLVATHGYVIDPRDNERIVLYFNSDYPVRNGDQAQVLRRKGLRVADLVLSIDQDGAVFGRVENRVGNREIRPMDLVLLKREGGVTPLESAPKPGGDSTGR